MQAFATFETDQASRHLHALCRHFARRVPVTTDDQSGHVAFPFGDCALHAAGDALEMAASAEDRVRLDRVIEVVTRHLERFAFRENPILSWTMSEPLRAQPLDIDRRSQ
ncbi:MAG: DUF2218 domain-containing protein [Pseudomonadota bacterium]